MNLTYPTDSLLSASRWFALAFAFFIPLSTALMNVFLALTILCLALSGQYGRSFKAILGNRFVMTALLLFALLALGVLYSASGYEAALERLEKYGKLLLAALLFPVFLDSGFRRFGVYSFLAAMTLVLIAIYAMLLGLVEESGREAGNIIRYTVDGGFKSRIITSILMAFSAYAFMLLSRRAGRLKPLFWLLAALAAAHVLILSSGLTGRLILFALMGLVFIQSFGTKRGVAAFLFSTAVTAAAMYFASDSFRQRIDNIRNIRPEAHQEGRKTSVEYRLEFLKKGIALVRSKPLVGHGTGGVVADQAPGAERELLNLHNQYLMVWGEVGIIGLGLLLYLFYIHWRLSGGLQETERRLSRGVVVTMAVSALFNSFILDSGESHFYFYFATLFLSRLADRDYAAVVE